MFKQQLLDFSDQLAPCGSKVYVSDKERINLGSWDQNFPKKVLLKGWSSSKKPIEPIEQ